MASDTKDKLVDMVLSFYKSDRKWLIAKRTALAIAFTLGVVITLTNFFVTHGRWPIMGDYAAVVNIKGVIADGGRASANNIIPALNRAFKDDSAKAVFLQIDSPGGSPLEAERIYTVMAQLKAEYPKPVIAVINTMGASAAYLVAIHADKIVSGRYSLVGSIGMIMSTYNVSGAAQKFNIEKYNFASGPFKSFLDPLEPVSETAHKKAQEMVTEGASLFIAEVKAARGDKLANNNVFTGESWLGSEAKALGLVDEIGTLESISASYKLPLSVVGGSGRGGMFMSASIIEQITASISEKVIAKLMHPTLN